MYSAGTDRFDPRSALARHNVRKIRFIQVRDLILCNICAYEHFRRKLFVGITDRNRQADDDGQIYMLGYEERILILGLPHFLN